jgi:hypothetical protein
MSTHEDYTSGCGCLFFLLVIIGTCGLLGLLRSRTNPLFIVGGVLLIVTLFNYFMESLFELMVAWWSTPAGERTKDIGKSILEVIGYMYWYGLCLTTFILPFYLLWSGGISLFLFPWAFFVSGFLTFIPTFFGYFSNEEVV